MSSNLIAVAMERKRSKINNTSKALKEKERQDYDAIATYYDANITPITDVFGWRTVDLLDVQPRHQVLELACGSGSLLPGLAQRVGENGSVTGFDQSENMLALAREKCIGHLDTIRLIRGDAEQLNEVENASYDRIVSVFGFMYLPNPVAALKRARAVLKPGGRAAIAVWGVPEAVPGLAIPMEAAAYVLAPPPLRWILRTSLGRKLLYKQLRRDRIGGGKSPMCLGAKGLIEGMMASAGFRDIRREELSKRFMYGSVDAYWQALMGTPARLLVQQYPAAQIAKTKAIVGRLLEQRFRTTNGRLSVPMGAVIVVGKA